jgi:hypothetical protein
MACKCTQKKKEPAGGVGNFKYTFDCVRDDGSHVQIAETSGNDNEAKTLAESDCNDSSLKR